MTIIRNLHRRNGEEVDSTWLDAIKEESEGLWVPISSPSARQLLTSICSVQCKVAIGGMGAYLAHEMGINQLEEFMAHIRVCETCHSNLLAFQLYFHANVFAK